MMKRIRYLSLAVLLSGSIATRGQSGDFNPANPGEPGLPPSKLVLLVQPAGGGSAGGGGKYLPGTTVTVRASAATGFVFDCWTDTKGKPIAASTNYNHVKGEQADTLVANFRYTPGSPAEPSEPSLTQYFRLSVGTAEGGSAWGGGKYLSGSSISLSCNVSTGFDFVGWYDSAGQLVSTERTFTYVTTAQNETLTPRFRFNPGSPAEPPVPVLRHDLAVEATEGGTVSAGSYRLLEGSTTTVQASANTGYEFVRWLKDGEPYTTLSSFSYTMAEKDVRFKAEFRWNPANPSEPQKPTSKKYAYYLMSVIGKPGDLLHYPIFLTSLDPLCDMTFRLTFPAELKPALASVALSEKAQGYSVSYAAESDTSYVFSLVGGQTAAGNTLLLSFDVPVPADLATGLSWPVKINQVAVTEPDGTRLTASTRNGRIYIYKKGDTNGDGNVDLLDKLNLVSHLLQEKTEVFIPEVSDTNDDGSLDLVDCMGIVELIASGEN